MMCYVLHVHQRNMVNICTLYDLIQGSSHPNIGVVLTCIAIMFGHKAKLERSSSILIQEVGQMYFCAHN